MLRDITRLVFCRTLFITDRFHFNIGVGVIHWYVWSALSPQFTAAHNPPSKEGEQEDTKYASSKQVVDIDIAWHLFLGNTNSTALNCPG